MNITGLKVTTEIIDDRGSKTTEAFVKVYRHTYDGESKQLLVNARMWVNQAAYNAKLANILPTNRSVIIDGNVFESIVSGYDSLNESYRQLSAYFTKTGLTVEVIEE